MPLRIVRPLLLTPLLAAALLLSACTSSTQTCKDGLCSITLSGNGASVTVGGDGDGGSTLELVSTDGKSARFKVDGTEGNLTKDVPVGFGENATITLKEIDGSKVKVTVDTKTAPEDAAIGN